MSLLTAENISKSYGQLKVLNDVSVTIPTHKLSVIIGPSGAGKSTLLHILGSLDKPDYGSVKFEDKEITQFNMLQLSQFRNTELGFVFQFHHLLPEFSALENVKIPALIAKKNENLVEKEAKYWLDELGLSHRYHHKPDALSGGEQQRVAVARALINKPKLILADEPTGNLDTNNAEHLHVLFQQLIKQHGFTFLVVTHNQHLSQLADHIIIMRDGKVIVE